MSHHCLQNNLLILLTLLLFFSSALFIHIFKVTVISPLLNSFTRLIFTCLSLLHVISSSSSSTCIKCTPLSQFFSSYLLHRIHLCTFISRLHVIMSLLVVFCYSLQLSCNLPQQIIGTCNEIYIHT